MRRTRPGRAPAADVSCGRADVAAGGFFTSGRPAYKACNVAAPWDGTASHVMRLPGAAGFPAGYDHLNQGPASISHATARTCMAAGSFVNARTRRPDSVAIAWNGTKWRLTKLRGPRSGIADVSCPLAHRCIAVGHAGRRTLAERRDGTSWTVMKTPGI